ncbi:MAG: ABC transporter substrate-binding protein [Pseudomonadota bacterium]
MNTILTKPLFKLLILIIVLFYCLSVPTLSGKGVNSGMTGNSLAWADDAKGQTCVDMAGRTVRVKGKATRVVTTFKPATLFMMTLGLQDLLAGIDTPSKNDLISRALIPDIDTIPGVGSKDSGINLETIISIAPDLVILFAQKNGISMADRLSAMDIPSVVIFPETFENIRQTLRLMATAIGAPERSVSVEQEMDAILDRVGAVVATLPAKNRKTGYFASPRGLFNTAPGTLLQDELFARAGIINVAHDMNGYFQDISPEQFTQWNPDMVFLSRKLGDHALKQLDNPAFKTVTAVKTGAVYRFPSDITPWDFPSPLSTLAILWLADKAYPEHFHGMDIPGLIDGFHTRLFGKSLTELSTALNLPPGTN